LLGQILKGKIMQVIWFKSFNGQTVCREFDTLDKAQDYWDALEWLGFHMVSTRP
jgi:hypothetical protein